LAIGNLACRRLDFFAVLSISLNIKTCCLYIIRETQGRTRAKIFFVPKNMHYRTPILMLISRCSG